MSNNDVSKVKRASEGVNMQIEKHSFLQEFGRKVAKFPLKVTEEWNRVLHRGFTFRGLDRWVRGMSHYEYERYRWHKGIVIRKDGRVNVPTLEFSLADGCNLKCEFCVHLNPFRTGFVSKETLIDSFEKWSRKIATRNVMLIGGEPLLNPGIAEIIIAVQRCWPRSQRRILTNGVLLPRVSDDVLRVFHKYNVFVGISEHMDTPEHRENLKQSLSRLRQFRILYSVNESFRGWHNGRDVDAYGVPVPCNSNPETAHQLCCAKHCPTIQGDRLYSCSHLANMIAAVQEGAIGPEWRTVLAHRPVTLESSPEEIRNYLRAEPMPECSVCPETYKTTKARQLSMEEVQQIKHHIRERHQKVA